MGFINLRIVALAAILVASSTGLGLAQETTGVEDDFDYGWLGLLGLAGLAGLLRRRDTTGVHTNTTTRR